MSLPAANIEFSDVNKALYLRYSKKRFGQPFLGFSLDMIGDVRLDTMAWEAPALALLGRVAIFGESMRRVLHTLHCCCLF